MRMGPHHLMPRDADTLKGARLGRGTARRGVAVRQAVPRHDRRVPHRDPGRRTARPRPAARHPRDPRHRDPRRQSPTHLLARRGGRRCRPRRRRAADRPALVQRPRRRGPDRRPPPRPVRQGAAPADRVLHPHADRCDHEPPQQRRHRRPDRGHEHARQRGEQRHRADHVAGRDARPRVATDPDGARRAPHVRHPGAPGGTPSPGHLARADAAQRRHEHPDDRALQRVGRDARQAVRRPRPRERDVRPARERGARRRHPLGDARARLLRGTRARRRARRRRDLRRRCDVRRRRRHHDGHARRPRRPRRARVSTPHRVDQRQGRPDDVDGELRAGVRRARCAGGDPGAARRGRPGRPEGPRRVRRCRVPLPARRRIVDRVARAADDPRRRSRPRRPPGRVADGRAGRDVGARRRVRGRARARSRRWCRGCTT